MTEKLVEMYCKLVKEQSRSIERVPANLRDDVKAKLEAEANAT